MSTSAAVQHNIQIRPSRLAALLVAVATLTAVTTWSVGSAVDSNGSAKTKTVASTYVDEVVGLTPAQQAAMFGNVSVADQIARLSPAQQAAIYGNVLPSAQYVDGVVAMSPAQRAAAFGNVMTP